MSENSAQQRKDELLMRLARQRVSILSSMERIDSRTGACAEALYLDKPIVRKGIVAVVSAFAATVSLRILRRKEQKDTPRLSAGVGFGRYVAAKLLVSVLIPWLQRFTAVAEKPAPRRRGFFRRLLSRS